MYEARAKGAEQAEDIAETLRERTQTRLRFLYGDFQGALPGIAAEAVRERAEKIRDGNRYPPTVGDMIALLDTMEQDYENERSAKEFLTRERQQRIAIRQKEKERATAQLERIPGLPGITEPERKAITAYFSSIAEQDPEDLPEQTTVEQVLAEKAARKANDRVVQLARDLGVYIDGVNAPTRIS